MELLLNVTRIFLKRYFDSFDNVNVPGIDNVPEKIGTKEYLFTVL